MITNNRPKLHFFLEIPDDNTRILKFCEFLRPFYDQIKRDTKLIDKLGLVYPEKMLGFKYKNALKKMIKEENNVKSLANKSK